MNARAAELGHARAQGRQLAEIEFGLAVEAAGAARCIGRENAIGADDLVALFAREDRAHHQVGTEIVEAIGVVAGRRAGHGMEPCAHLAGKDLMAQALDAAQVVDRIGPACREPERGLARGGGLGRPEPAGFANDIGNELHGSPRA